MQEDSGIPTARPQVATPKLRDEDQEADIISREILCLLSVKVAMVTPDLGNTRDPAKGEANEDGTGAKSLSLKGHWKTNPRDVGRKKE